MKAIVIVLNEITLHSSIFSDKGERDKQFTVILVIVKGNDVHHCHITSASTVLTVRFILVAARFIVQKKSCEAASAYLLTCL